MNAVAPYNRTADGPSVVIYLCGDCHRRGQLPVYTYIDMINKYRLQAGYSGLSEQQCSLLVCIS